MRDAFGGVFMIRLLLVFIVIYVAFSAISLNYAKAYRIKNSVISAIEESEITTLDDIDKNEEFLTKLDVIVASTNYAKECNSKLYDGKGYYRDGQSILSYCHSGIVIENAKSTKKEVNYTVYTFAGWELQTLNMVLGLAGKDQTGESPIYGTWAVKGEAKVKIR